jgi:penicillin G amidase
VIVVLLVLPLSAFYLITHLPFPQIKGQLRLAGLSRPVKVLRDSWGVPHLFAENEKDLFFAAGYVQAQDRLFQMDLNRRAATGRLAEALGDIPEVVDTDRFARTVGFARDAEAGLAGLPPHSRELVDAFSRGINAFIHGHQNNLPLEFRLLGYRPPDWTAGDTMAVAKLIGWGLGENWSLELIRLALAQERGEEIMGQILPRHRDPGPYIIDPAIKNFPGRSAGLIPAPVRAANLSSPTIEKLLQLDRSLRRYLNGSDPGHLASNSWVIAGKRSASGHPILCNDPHLELTIPAVWYEMHLVCPDYDVIGAAFPGTPMIVLGHTRRIAWGATTTTADMEDLFIEKIHPDHPEKYLDHGRWVDFKIVTERIKIKPGQAGARDHLDLQVRISRHGPIINDVAEQKPKAGEALALRYAGQDPSDPVAALADVARAQNWDEFRRAIQQLGFPVQNWIYADAEHIGYIAAGYFPIRPQGDGIAPVPGWDGDYDWQGFVPLDQLPQLLDPADGVIVTANNKVMPAEAAPYVISYNYGPPYRAERIHELLDQKSNLTMDDMKRIQMDVFSKQAERLLPIFLKVLEPAAGQDHDFELALRHLRDWKFELAADDPAPTIFFETYRRAFEKTYADEISPALYQTFLSTEFAYNGFDNLLESGSSPLFDDRRTARVETRDDVIRAAFEEAIAALKKEYGPRISTWTWGRAHTLSLTHPLAGGKPLKPLADMLRVNLGPFPMPGGWNTVDNQFYSYAHDGFQVKVGPSLRQIVDLARVQDAAFVYSGGQSGLPLHRHYADQTPLWLRGDYHPMWMDEAEVRRHLEGELVLEPGNRSR